MRKAEKSGVAIGLSLLLSLALLVTGVLAGETATAQNTDGVSSRAVTQTGVLQYGRQQAQPLANVEPLKAVRASAWCGRRACPRADYSGAATSPLSYTTRYAASKTQVVCRWVVQWVRGVRRSVRVCRNYW